MYRSLFVVILCLAIGVLQVQADHKKLRDQVRVYDGKSYSNLKSPGYVSYDSALRNYMVEHIQRQFGVGLDPMKYSGFNLLEIESLFNCKKSSEPFDLFLKEFPRQP
jgi:hypothetical protein